MWKATLRVFAEADAGSVDPTIELMQETSRTLIFVTDGTYLGLQLLAGVIAPDRVGMAIWFMVPVLVLTSALALRLIPKQVLAAQIVWQAGLVVIITLAACVFRLPVLAFLYVMLPFMAVVSVGWPAGLLAEGLVVAVSWWLSHGSVTPLLPPGYSLAIAAAGAFAGLVGWAASRSLYTVTHWSLQSFAQARRNMEDARRHRAQLARVVKDLDQAYHRLERTNAALVAAWRAAAEAERFKAEFATDLSHELRTPLSLIIGFCEMMMTAPQKYEGIQIPRPYRSDLNAVYHNAQHLMALVNDVLDLARIDAGKLALVRDEVDAASLVAEAVDMVRDYIEAKGLELRVDMGEALPTLWIDRLRIRQVLLNLLVNAARFTERGWIAVEVARLGEQVVIRVADTGQGIPRQELSRIFEEFRQAGPPPSAGWPSSTGLGLPISRRLVELHGGRMGVESTYLRGATFWFTIPCAPPLTREPEVGRLVRTQPLKRMGASERIVVVAHDDLRVVSLLQRYLEGYRVIGATNLDEAASLANQLKAVALIGDTSQASAKVPDNLLLVSCPLPSSRQAAEVFGAQDFLVKPISSQELWAAIDGVDCPVERVLIADDDPEMVRLIRRMLSSHVAARDCLEAHNGEETLHLLQSEKPDLLLLDLMMPEVSGHDVLAQMATEPSLASIPTIIISAKGQDEVELRFSAPIQISKPAGLRLGELVRALEANLGALTPGWH